MFLGIVRKFNSPPGITNIAGFKILLYLLFYHRYS